MPAFELAGQKISEPPFQKRHDSAQEKQPHTPARSPEAAARAFADGAGVELRYLAPAALDALVKKDTEFWAKTIKSAGIKPE